MVLKFKNNGSYGHDARHDQWPLTKYAVKGCRRKHVNRLGNSLISHRFETFFAKIRLLKVFFINLGCKKQLKLANFAGLIQSLHYRYAYITYNNISYDPRVSCRI